MIVSPPQCPYRHHHASGWPPRFYESQVSNTKIQVHFVRTCWCQRLRHSCRGKKNHPRAPLHHSSNVLVWVGLGNRVCTTLSNFKRNSLFHQFWWFLWQSCDYRWSTSYRSIWIREGKLTNQHFFGIMSPQLFTFHGKTKSRFAGKRRCKGNDPPVVWDIFDLNQNFLFKRSNQTGTSKLQAFHKWVDIKTP